MPRKTTPPPRRQSVIHSLNVTGAFVNKGRGDCYDALNLLSTPLLKDMLRARNIGIPKTKHEMIRRLNVPYQKGKIGILIRIDVEIERTSLAG
jgi:hypothetical protein